MTVALTVTLGAGVVEGVGFTLVGVDEPQALTRTAVTRPKPAPAVTCRRCTPRPYASQRSEFGNEPLTSECPLDEICGTGSGVEAKRLTLVHRQ